MLSDTEDITDVTLDEIVEQKAEVEKQQIIEENLKKVKFHKSKLRFAQECYYGEKGRSPLTRSSNNFTTSEFSKPPVHARLGRRRLRAVPLNIGTGTLPPKNRLIFRLNRTNKASPGKFFRLYRNCRAQLRIERIRKQQAESLQNSQLVQPINKFRLRRRNPIGLPFHSPTNYMVQIPNNTFMNDNSLLPMHSIQAELDEHIQNEIMKIQMIHTHPSEMIQMLSPLPVMTRTTLNDRFSALP